jgi:hypothetical protein
MEASAAYGRFPSKAEKGSRSPLVAWIVRFSSLSGASNHGTHFCQQALINFSRLIPSPLANRVKERFDDMILISLADMDGVRGKYQENRSVDEY